MSETNHFRLAPQEGYHLHPQSQLREVHHAAQPVWDDVQNFQVLQNPRSISQFPMQGFIPSSSYSREEFGALSTGKADLSTSRYLSILDSKQLSCLSEGGSKISNPSYYNPFASTFEQPPGRSIFNSNFRQHIDTNYGGKFDFPDRLRHVSVDGKCIGGVGPRHTASPPNSSKLGEQILAKSGSSLLPASLGGSNECVHSQGASSEVFPGTQTLLLWESRTDQYDPLFDSIEPSSSSVRKFGCVQARELTTSIIDRPLQSRVASDSETVLKFSGSHELLNAEEANKLKKDAALTAVHSPENDEFGETAMDAEVGVVDNGSPEVGNRKNWSPGNPDDPANTGMGENEVDQVQTSGKSKKSKDSRSMKLFKIALADFVKEVLKPSWRQGNMSKEAFKTIVKKTVDKVSGAMKSHQIPKSQAKINQYIESSQHKLTKLVMGYVDKYVKVLKLYHSCSKKL
ncbi:PREDICTED: uncharacterized protein LOC104599449 [Nelumbo nucifera]|uniref:SFR19-like C-terminal domain-containing protein n=2 Tax=Nelumbo nucifera TaxID=4432 RepID=A0A822YLL4_NELNU|nr:PREDICTED: uncharacterized protein LOC104599449 [Nelumbo nucifera]DAD35064.1 TPA_asm: hypothetical protein HUJ06_005704 [Nelumbo nucifera]